MLWLLIAFIGPICYGLANVLDNYLSNRLFRNPATLVFYSSLFNVAFLPFIFLIQWPTMVSLRTFPALFGLGLMGVLYLYPYYRALQLGDTSIISSFFALGKIFVPILAFFLLNEVLTLRQYVGFFLVVMGGAFLSYERRQGRITFNSAFWYMALASLAVTFDGILYKYLYEQGVNWSTALGGSYLVAFFLGLLFFIPRGTRRDISAHAATFRHTLPLFGFEELLTFIAVAATAYAFFLAPVSLVKSIDAFSPFFALLYAVLFAKSLPRIFKERVERGIIMKKVSLFAVMVAGIVLIVS